MENDSVTLRAQRVIENVTLWRHARMCGSHEDGSLDLVHVAMLVTAE